MGEGRAPAVGPWSVDIHPITGEFRIVSKKGPIALVAVCSDEYTNASLLAAASEMLEILRTSRGNVASLGPAGALAHVHTPYREWLYASTPF